jgi:hypothetical protein
LRDHLDAWAAGFLDGEGYFAAVPRGDSYRPVMTATQVGLAPLVRLRSLYGGHVMDHASNGAHRWQIIGAQGVEAVLDRVIPYLTLRLLQAEILRDLCAFILPRGAGGGTPAMIAQRHELAAQLNIERRRYRVATTTVQDVPLAH